MIAEINKNTTYMFLKAFRNSESIFVRSDDEFAKQVFKNRCENRDLWVSPNLYTASSLSAKQICPLRFHIVAENLTQARRNAIEACYYITQNFAIQEEGVEVIYNGGKGPVGSMDSNATAITEMVVIISPIVFGRQPIQLMPLINYHLARDLIRAGINNIDIDVYQQDRLLRMSNSFDSSTSRYAIPLTFKELLYLSPDRITELAQNPRPEDSMVIPRVAPQAVEWFNDVCKEEEKRQYRQSQLQKLILEKGWQITPCSRRLLWADLSKEQAIEACRIISQFYSWIKAGLDEIWHYLQQIDRRNHIGDYPRLKAIIAFALENPKFAGCEHPLLERLCPAGNCFMAELKKEYESPYLFKPGGKQT